MTSIEWTDKTWNPVVGCSRVSKGCERCYAERVAHRGMLPQHKGLTVLGKHGPRWTGEVRFLADRLAEPLSWRKPRRVFVNSMSDLFHESLSIPDIARVFAVMAQAERHTFQVLTKRAKRMREVLASQLFWADVDLAHIEMFSGDGGTDDDRDRVANACGARVLPNVMLGVSVEDQATADERIPHLLACPAAVRWVSYEPALGPVDFGLVGTLPASMTGGAYVLAAEWLHWIVVGGESGPGARPFDVAWARSVIAQCRDAGVPVFVKQLGAVPHVGDAGAGWAVTYGERGRHWRMDDNATDPLTVYEIRDRKGGDMSEWPEGLRVRQWPEVRRA